MPPHRTHLHVNVLSLAALMAVAPLCLAQEGGYGDADSGQSPDPTYNLADRASRLGKARAAKRQINQQVDEAQRELRQVRQRLLSDRLDNDPYQKLRNRVHELEASLARMRGQAKQSLRQNQQYARLQRQQRQLQSRLQQLGEQNGESRSQPPANEEGLRVERKRVKLANRQMEVRTRINQMQEQAVKQKEGYQQARQKLEQKKKQLRELIHRMRKQMRNDSDYEQSRQKLQRLKKRYRQAQVRTNKAAAEYQTAANLEQEADYEEAAEQQINEAEDDYGFWEDDLGGF